MQDSGKQYSSRLAVLTSQHKVFAEKSTAVQQRDDEIASLQHAALEDSEEDKGLDGEIHSLWKQCADFQAMTSKLQGEFEALQAWLKRGRGAPSLDTIITRDAAPGSEVYDKVRFH